LSKAATPGDKTKNRTSIDLEIDLQAYRLRVIRLNEEIQALKELKQKLQESKEKGTALSQTSHQGFAHKLLGMSFIEKNN